MSYLSVRQMCSVHPLTLFDRDLEVVRCVKCENLNDCVLYESSVCIIVDCTCYLNVDY